MHGRSSFLRFWRKQPADPAVAQLEAIHLPGMWVRALLHFQHLISPPASAAHSPAQSPLLQLLPDRRLVEVEAAPRAEVVEGVVEGAGKKNQPGRTSKRSHWLPAGCELDGTAK